jgi:RNA polymerase sigma factor (sigma-70 family)
MSQFETTRWSLVFAARDAQPSADTALAQLCVIYRPAVLAFVRRCCRNVSDAEDLTQSFFERLLSKRIDMVADPTRGRFRNFLRTAISNFIKNTAEFERAERRFAIIDERLEPNEISSPESAFEAAWTISVLQRALDQLEQEALQAGKGPLFALIKEQLLESGEKRDYDLLAPQLSMRSNTIAVNVHRFKTRMREIVRGEVLQTIADPSELNDELRALRSIKKTG